MKPETIERRSRESAERRKQARNEAIPRLTALVERDGPDSIWPELLAEARERITS